MDIDFTFGVETRKLVLKESLRIEHNLSNYLCSILEIDQEESKLFGNKSTSLSFNTKVLLLLDMKFIDKTDRDKLQAFMEIRNQFMHNIKATTFEKCFNILDGTKNFLVKSYPEFKNKNTEEDLEELFFTFSKDIRDILKKVFDKLLDIHSERRTVILKKEYFDKLLDNLCNVLDNVGTAFQSMAANHPTIETKELITLGESLKMEIWNKTKADIEAMYPVKDEGDL